MKKTYIKPEIEIFQFEHQESLLLNCSSEESDGSIDIGSEETDDQWSNKRDWSNTDSKSFWK